MTQTRLPAIAFAAAPGRRAKTLEIAKEFERRGFAGLYCASFGDGVGLCEALALETERIPFGTTVANMYMRHATDYASTSSLIHELSGGRFHFGVGVSHAPINNSLGVKTGKPLGDTRHFVETYRGARVGDRAPLVLAAMRQKMVALAGELADGLVFANAARSHIATSLSHVPAARLRDPSFFVGDMLPTCISDDRAAAAAVCRKQLTMYVSLPNYRNYWKEAGYVDEMQAIEKALAAGERKRLPELMSDRWLADVSLFGSATEVRDGVEAWFDAGIRTPIIVPSSAVGNQLKAFEEIFATFS